MSFVNHLRFSRSNQEEHCNDNKFELKIHNAQNGCKCVYCGKSFIEVQDLNKHILFGCDMMVLDEPIPESINISKSRSFSKADMLKKHIYKDNKDSICESCGKSFPNDGNLKRHIHTVHEGKKDYKCESCGKLFNKAK